jgi:hypothetical protein
MSKKVGFKELGITPPSASKATLLSVRLANSDADKLRLLAKQLGVRGRSTMARLIIEKFVAEHDPTVKGKR